MLEKIMSKRVQQHIGSIALVTENYDDTIVLFSNAVIGSQLDSKLKNGANQTDTQSWH
jgi:hypothetical protein